MSRTYLDYNATAPLRPEARAAVLAALDATGNASSVHGEGRAARKLIEQARADVAALVGRDARYVTFTSGGTEANDTVLTPDWSFNGKPRRADVLFHGATEHPSVTAGGRFARNAVKPIPVDGEGIVDLVALEAMLAAATSNGQRALISVMLANNETGAIQPVRKVADIAHAHNATVHTDAVQAAGRIPVDIAALGVDVLTLSAHKIGGPQGAGAILRATDAWSFSPLLTGGGQEKRHRAGTENVAATAGFGAAAKIAAPKPEWAAWRDRLAAIVGPSATVFSAKVDRLPNTLCFSLPGLPAETVLIALDLAGIAVSSGSACSSGKVSPSHVLAAMNVPPDLAKCAIRLTLGWASTEADLDSFATAWRHVVSHLAPGTIQAA